MAAIGHRIVNDFSEMTDEQLVAILMNFPGIDSICVNTIDMFDYNMVESGEIYIEGDVLANAKSIFGISKPWDFGVMDFSNYETFGYDIEDQFFYKGSYSGRGNYYEIMIDDVHEWETQGLKVDYTYASYKTNSNYTKRNPSSQEYYTAYFEKNADEELYPYSIVKIETNMSVYLTEDNWVPLCVTDTDGNVIPLEDVFGEDNNYYNRLVFYDEDSGFDNDYGLTLRNYTNGNSDGMRWGDFEYKENEIILYCDFSADSEPLYLSYGELYYLEDTFTTLSWKDCVKYSASPEKEYVIYFARESAVIDSEEYLENMMN